ncbi:MAG TPA: hypothetical protein DDW93_08190 [Firmicutes bacterium]|nr:hypothetical protein [Bacillota bacterium]HBT18236.1 hypothetical protein [Bacillota bacterium]
MKKTMLIFTLAIVTLITLVFSASASVNLEWWTADAGEQSIITWMDNTLKQFMAENSDIKFERTDMQDEDLKIGLKSAMAAGIPPTIWMSWGGGILKSYVEEGQVADITDLIKSKGEVIPQSVLSSSTFSGKHYGLPYTSWSGHIYINKELFRKAGVQIPDITKNETWTWEELIAAINKFKKHNIIPFTVGGKEKWELSFYYMYLVDRYGGSDCFSNTLDRKKGYSFNNAPFVKAGKRIQELVKIGAFQKGFLGAGYLDAQRYFFNGRAAMYLMGTWFVGDLRKQAPNMDVGIIRFPTVPDGKGNPTNLLGAPQTVFCISEAIGTQEKIAAKKFLNYLSSEKVVKDFVTTVGDVVVFKMDLPENCYDPLIRQVIKEMEDANYMQMAWDQYSPPQFASVHLDNMAYLFSGRKSAEEVAKNHENEAVKLK